MKLIYRISLRLSLVLLPLIALWAVVFYFTMVDEINDEVDDALEDYSELIVIRMLSGELLPRMNEGSNNSYTIHPGKGGDGACPFSGYHISGRERTVLRIESCYADFRER